MAEIDLQQKKRPLWPWIVGALVVALAIWGIAEVVDPGEELAETESIDVVAPAAEPMPAEPPTELPAAVGDYTETARGFATAEMGRQHEYTASALQALVPALQTIVDRDTVAGTPVRQQLEELRNAAERIQQTAWTADTHANEVKSAFTTTATLLAQLHRDMAPTDTEAEPAIQEVQAAADALNADQPLLDQGDAVQRFFAASADAIERLARS